MASLHQRLYGPTVLSDERVVELDCRESSDEKVELLWSPDTTNTYIRHSRKQYGLTRVILVPNEKARDAFVHPYCYYN